LRFVTVKLTSGEVTDKLEGMLGNSLFHDIALAWL
jgi:hypothetical protein